MQAQYPVFHLHPPWRHMPAGGGGYIGAWPLAVILPKSRGAHIDRHERGIFPPCIVDFNEYWCNVVIMYLHRSLGHAFIELLETCRL